MVIDQIERVAVVGDWHMNWRWGRRAIDHAKDQGAQGLLHTGDFAYTFQPEFLDQLDSMLTSRGLRLWWVDGNHENHEKLQRWPLAGDGTRPITDRIIHLPRGLRWQWAGVRFLALGGAYSVDRMARVPGREWWEQETLTRRQVHQAQAGGPVDVMVSHDCPAVVQIPGIDDRPRPDWIAVDDYRRSVQHRKLLDQVVKVVRPRRIFHGHYHHRHDTVAQLGYGPVTVTGLDCDESSLDDNVTVVNVAEILGASAGQPL